MYINLHVYFRTVKGTIEITLKNYLLNLHRNEIILCGLYC